MQHSRARRPHQTKDRSMLYDFVPISERKPLRWPNGKRLALLITLNLEYWELTQDRDGPYFAGGPSINDRLLPARVPDFNNYTWREYGHRIGIWRLYDVFDRAGVPASCTVNGIMCEAASADRQGCRLARLGTDRAQLDPDRQSHQLPRRSRQGARGHQAHRRRHREVQRPPPARLVVVIAPLHSEHPDILKELGLIYHSDLHERRAALSHPHRWTDRWCRSPTPTR